MPYAVSTSQVRRLSDVEECEVQPRVPNHLQHQHFPKELKHIQQRQLQVRREKKPQWCFIFIICHFF